MANPSQPSKKTFSMETITAEPPRYLWEPYLRRGNLNIIRGDGGAGKTMLAVAIAAAVTQGTQPAGMPGFLDINGSGNVFILSNEDDFGELRHRLDLCGADASRIFSCQPAAVPALGDTNRITALIQESNAVLLVLDPLQAFLPHGTDINSASDMRPLLEGLRSACRNTDCTALVLEHLNKASKMSAIQRGLGSMDIINASRSALYVCPHPHNPALRVALHVKANAKRGRSIAFSIDDSGVFSWAGDCSVTEEDVSNARIKAPTMENPVTRLIRVLADRPQGWSGYASQLAQNAPDYDIAVDAVTIGKTLPGLIPSLKAEGIIVTKQRKPGGTFYIIRREGR